jgi:hypothetical protein
LEAGLFTYENVVGGFVDVVGGFPVVVGEVGEVGEAGLELVFPQPTPAKVSAVSEIKKISEGKWVRGFMQVIRAVDALGAMACFLTAFT